MEKTNRNYRRQTYIEGNTVRQMEAAPDYRREIEHRRKEEAQREEQKRRNRNIARRNQARVAHMNLGYVFFLTLAVAVIGAASVMYINLQSDITGHLKTISSLESQITDVKSDNDAAEKRINSSVDIAAVKDAAMNQLGMIYASADQIVHYSVDKEDYMDQYEDIPNN